MSLDGLSCSPAITEDTPILSWTVHLARKQPRKLALIFPIFLLTLFWAYYLVGVFGIAVAFLGLTAALADFLFPVHYEITTQRATCRRLLGITEIRWGNVKRCYLDDLGVKLSPLPRLSRLEAYRGVFLRFDGNDSEVIEAVRSVRENKC
jgi:hypothetical protein